MKRIVSLIVVILTINTIYCEIAINKVSMETLLEIPYGKSIRQLGKEYDYGGAEHQSITDIVITKDYFIFGDQWNNRFVKASHDLSDFIVLPNIDINTVSGFLEIKNNHLYNYDILSNSVFKYDLETNTMEFHSRSFLDGHTGLSTQKVIYWGSTIFEDLFIGEAKNNSFVVIDTKKENEKPYSILLNNEAIEYITNNSSVLKIISEKYLFENDMFITKSPSKFLSFFKKSFSRDEIKSFKELEFEEDAKFSGIDKDGNYYWTSYAGCFVFDKTGKLLTLFVIDFKEARRSDMPRFAIDNDGNAYRLIKGEDCYYLKMVKRYW